MHWSGHVCDGCPAAHEVLPGLWLGSAIAARDPEAPYTHVVSLGVDPPFPGPGRTYLDLAHLLDMPQVDLLAELPSCTWAHDHTHQASSCASHTWYTGPRSSPWASSSSCVLCTAGVSFLRSALAVGRVCLVHCVYGQSRSATVVTAYVMAAMGWDADTALAFVRDRRPCIGVNPGCVRAELCVFFCRGPVDTSTCGGGGSQPAACAFLSVHQAALPPRPTAHTHPQPHLHGP